MSGASLATSRAAAGTSLGSFREFLGVHLDYHTLADSWDVDSLAMWLPGKSFTPAVTGRRNDLLLCLVPSDLVHTQAVGRRSSIPMLRTD